VEEASVLLNATYVMAVLE